LTVVVTRRTAPPELLDLGVPVLFDPNAQTMATVGVHATPSLVVLDPESRLAEEPLIGAPAVLEVLSAPAVTR
jgi:hypothetical protein